MKSVLHFNLDSRVRDKPSSKDNPVGVVIISYCVVQFFLLEEMDQGLLLFSNALRIGELFTFYKVPLAVKRGQFAEKCFSNVHIVEEG